MKLCSASFNDVYPSLIKRRSRHAAHAAKALRWRVGQIKKMPYIENNSVLVMVKIRPWLTINN